MKTRIITILSVFALILSFAFITVNKSEQEDKNLIKVNSPQDTPLTGYALEDEGQWD